MKQMCCKYFIAILMYCYGLILAGAGSNIGDPNSNSGVVVGGTWLQLMCCALPKCLCP